MADNNTIKEIPGKIQEDSREWKLLNQWDKNTRTQFLVQYRWWKLAWSEELFRELQKKLGKDGVTVNNHSELNDIAAIINGYHDKKIELVKVTQTATGDIKGEFSELQTDALREVNELSDKDFVKNFSKVLDFIVPLSTLNINQEWLTSEEKLLMAPYAPTLEGIAGTVLIKALTERGYEIRLRTDKTVELLSRDRKAGKPIADMQTRLNDAIKNDSKLFSLLQSGMLYASPNFRQYAELKGDIPTNSAEYRKYLDEKRRDGADFSEDRLFLDSEYSYKHFDFSRSLQGVKHLDAINAQAEKVMSDPKGQEQIKKTVEEAVTLNVSEEQIPAKPDGKNEKEAVYLSDQLNGTWWAVSGSVKLAKDIVGGGFKGFFQGFWDLLKLGDGDALATMGIGVALLWGVWKMFHLGEGGKFSFGRGLLWMLGLGAINNSPNMYNMVKSWDTPPNPTEAPSDGKDDKLAGTYQQWKNISYNAPWSNVDAGNVPPNQREDILRGVFGKPTESIDSERNITELFHGWNVAKLQEFYALNGSEEERQKEWAILRKDMGYDTLSAEGKKKIDELIANKDSAQKLRTYIAGLLAYPQVATLKQENPDKFNAMSIKEMEDYIIAHAEWGSWGGASGGNEKMEWTVQDLSGNISENAIITTTTSLIVREGKYYLVGPNGKEEVVNYEKIALNLNIPKNAPKNLQDSVTVMGDVAFLLDAFLRKYPKKQPEYETSVKGLETAFNHVDVQTGKKVLSVESMFPTSISTDAGKIFLEKDHSKRRLELLKYVRDTLGQYDLVAWDIIENQTKYFNFPSDENLTKEWWDLSSTGLSNADQEKVRAKIRHARTSASKDWGENHAAYIAAFQSQFPGQTIDADKAREHYQNLTILSMAKREIAYRKLYDQGVSWELHLLQDILGASKFDISDRSWDITTEAGKFIAIEALALAAWVVTAGFGTVAINTVAFGRNAYRWVELARAYNAASGVRRFSTTTARVLTQWAGFNFGTGLAHGIMRDDWSAVTSKEAYLQSIAMVGVMGALGKYFVSPYAPKALQIAAWKGFGKNALAFSGQVAIDSVAIFGVTGGVGKLMFDGRDNWTLEQMAQALIMATLFKGMSIGATQLVAYKTANGQPAVKSETVTFSEHLAKARIPNASGNYDMINISWNRQAKWNDGAKKYEIFDHKGTPLKDTTGANLQISRSELSAQEKTTLINSQKWSLEKFLNNELKHLEQGKEVTFGNITIKRSDTGNSKPQFTLSQNGTSRNVGNSKEIMKDLKEDDFLKLMVDMSKKTDYKGIIRLGTKDVSKTVNGHNVEVKTDGSIVVFQKGSPSVPLTATERSAFIQNNFGNIINQFGTRKIDLSSAGPALTGWKKWITDSATRFEKNYQNGSFMWNAFREITRPAMTVNQVFATLIEKSSWKGRWEDFLKILILWDRSLQWNKLPSYGRLALKSGAVAWTAFIDEDVDFVSMKTPYDFMLYSLGGFLWPQIAWEGITDTARRYAYQWEE